MSRAAHYEAVKAHARALRKQYGFTTPRVLLSDLRRIYKAEGIKIDLWPGKLKNLRGAYFRDEAGISVMISKTLPKEQRIFTMGHELKHHFVDAAATDCTQLTSNDEIEIGAEIFAVELIYPEADFQAAMRARNIAPGHCSPEDIVRLKRDTGATLSFTSLGKLATHLGFAANGAFDRMQWKKLEEELFGEPVYKRVLRRRGFAVR